MFSTGRTNAGVFINPDNVLTISAVWACIRYLSQSIAVLPWTVNENIKGGVSERVSNPVNALLKNRVSKEYSSYQFRELLMHWALRWGNGYAEIERDTIGRPLALWPLHPDRTALYRNPDNGDLYYEHYGDDGTVVLDPMDVFHLRGFGESPVGLNVVAYAAESIGWAKAAQLFGAGFFGNGANPSGIITMKRPLSPKGLENVRKEFANLYGGPDQASSTAVLDNDMQYQQLSVTPENGQFIQTHQHLVDEICRWFGVPPHKIYHLLRATFSNIEHQSIEVVVDSLMPWEKRFNDEANYKLLGQNRNNLFVNMDFSELLKGDSAARIAYFNGMRNMGAINVNEIRRREGMGGIGPEGELYLVQSQYTTLDSILNPPEPPAPPPPEPETDEPETDEPPVVTDSAKHYIQLITSLENGKWL